ncbi:MAG: hypothetical protein Q9207_007701 [Kuettlingeria erythrocarpa]
MFSLSAASSLLAYLGFIGCFEAQGANAENVAPPPLSNLTTSRVVLVTSTVIPRSSSAVRTINSASVITGRSNTTDPAVQSSSPRRSRPTTQTKIAVGVASPIIIILISALTFLGIIHYRKNKRRAQSISAKPESSTEDQPYLQQKGELDAEERRRFELDAEQKKYELEGDNDIHELPTTSNSCARTRLDRHEVRGEEQCKELRAEEHSKELD